ncbi:TPA: hypothetical protein ACRNCS_003372 [Pseudomonas aeruginosa]
MSYLQWEKTIIEKLVNAGLDPQLIGKAFNDAQDNIQIEYENGELTSAAACFIKFLEKYDLELELARKRGEGCSSLELGELYGISEAEARAGWAFGTKKRQAIFNGFRGGEVDFSEKKRRVLYYLPLVRVESPIKLSGFSIKPFLKDSAYGSLLRDSIFDGKGAVIEVDGFESGDYLDIQTDYRIYDALEKLKFGYFFLNPSYSSSFHGYVSSETFECFRIIEKNPDGSFEQKVELTNGMFSFLESQQTYYKCRMSHQQKMVTLNASALQYVGFLTDGLDSADHMAAVRMYNRCWCTHSIHSHHDKALLAKISVEILGELKDIKKYEVSDFFSKVISDVVNDFSKSSPVIAHIARQYSIRGINLKEKIELNLKSLKAARDELSHKGRPDFDHINVPFYLVWFPLFWLTVFCSEKLTETEGIRFSLFCGLMCFNVRDWQCIKLTAYLPTKSHLQIYDDNSRLFPKFLKKSPSEDLIGDYMKSVTNWLNSDGGGDLSEELF